MADAFTTTNINTGQGPILDIDIVSDVMCPWCIIGYKQLEQALATTGIGSHIRWHPFELNPDMPLEGQNMSEHIQQKYGSTPEQSAQSRDQMQTLGKQLGFTFNWSPDSRMWNTFVTHQLLDFALSQNKQQYWTSRGISGVPSMIFAGKYLVTGAQGADNYAEMLQRVAAETEAA